MTDPLLLVATCNGPRCAGLRRLTGHADCDDVMHDAVRRRHNAVLVTVPCLGPCHRGSVAVVGPGAADDSRHALSWTGAVTVLSCVEQPDRAAALALWITGDAPDRGALPRALTDDM